MIKVIRGGNFFSSTNCMLEDIIEYFNKNKKLPEIVDTSFLWRPYKKVENDDLANVFFEKVDKEIQYTEPVTFSSTDWETQFSDYNKLNFKQLQPFIEKYCTFTLPFQQAEAHIMEKYKLNLNNMCGVFLRGNDKWKETMIPTYSEMIVKAYQVQKNNPNIQFLVQTDEKEFLDEFKFHFPNSIYVEEVPIRYRRRDDSHSCMSFVLPQDLLFASTYYYVSVLKLMSKMKFVIMTSGNGEMWIPLWRGNTIGIYQYLSPKPVIYGVVNKTYDPYKLNFWIEK